MKRALLAIGYVLLGLAMVVGACAVTYQMATDHNDFPVGYHPDEPEKAQQIRDVDQLNFHHPLMLLEASRLVAQHRQLTPTATGFRATTEALVDCGRTASAIFVTVAIGAIALAGWRVGGLAGLATAATGAMCCPQLIIHGHYMKEDAALMCGFGLVVLGVTLTWMTRNLCARWAACAFLGFACGAAASGKLAGIVTLAAAVPTVLFAWRKASADPKFTWLRTLLLPALDRAFRLALLLATAAATFAAINHRAFDFDHGTADHYYLRPDAYFGLRGEVEHAEEGHYDSALAIPNAFFLRTTCLLTPAPLRILAAIALAGTAIAWMTRGWIWMVREKARRLRGETAPRPVYPGILRRIATGAALVMLLVVFLFALGHSAIPFRRYAAPAVLLTFVLAGLSVVMFARAVRPAWLAVVVSLVGIGAQCAILVPVANDAVDQFAHDSRDGVNRWIATLPPGTVLIADQYACAYSLKGSFVRGMRFSVDAGTRQEMARRGAKYVILCDTTYDRFLDRDALGDRLFQQRRDRYLDLLAQPPVWHGGGKWPSMTFTSPEIRVIALQPPDAKGTRILTAPKGTSR